MSDRHEPEPNWLFDPEAWDEYYKQKALLAKQD